MSFSKDQLYIYNLPHSILDSLELLRFDLETQKEVSLENTPEPSESIPSDVGENKPTVGDKEYYKSDLHRYNLKRALSNLPPLSEKEFDELLEKQSIESISGSEEEDENDDDIDQETDDAQALKLRALLSKLSVIPEDSDNASSISHLNTKSPFLLFKANGLPENKALALYKSMLEESQLLNTPLETLKSYSTTAKAGKSALFMIGGGHFAGAIVSHIAKNTKGNVSHTESRAEQAVDIVVSKTFHRYTVRKKQGGSQSASDNARGKANSAGSSIRRYNEQALMKEVRELLVEWKHHLAECTSIFIRANGTANRKILVGYPDAVIQSNDKRLKGFPFTTKRATTSELKRAWVELSYLKVTDLPKVNEKAVKRMKSPEPRAKQAVKAEISENDKHTTELIALLKRQNSPKLINYVKQNHIDVNQFRLSPEPSYVQYPTLLHYAASNGLEHMIQILLINLKADPTIENEFSKTPAQIGDSKSKQIFQVARGKLGEDAWDWEAAKVGPPKTKEEIENEEQQELEKEKLEKQRLIKEQLDQKTEMELSTPKIKSSGTLGGNTAFKMNELSDLSEQQKMRLMREQRARAAEARLKQLNQNK